AVAPADTAEVIDLGAIKLKSLVALKDVGAEWGPAKNGLRARMVPVLSSMSEDAIDPAQRVSKFAKPEDVAFAVELENVSDQPIELLDTRYGKSYGEAKGKAKSDWFGQFLFSIDLFDGDGQKIERPEVQVVDLNGVLDGAMVVSLEPGKSYRFLLRPAKWLSAMTQRIEPGRYRAAVTYHGLPARVVMRMKDYRPDQPVLAAVEGPIVSPQVALEVLPPDPPVKPNDANDEPPTRVWGEPSNGLRAAIEFLPRQGSYAHGEKLEAKLHVQNYGKKPITLASHLWLSELEATVKNEKGEPVAVDGTWYSGWTLSSRVTLKPKQVVVFDAGNLGLAITKERADEFEHVTNRKLVAPAGKYSMQLGARFGDSFLLKDGKGKVLAPLEGDWVGELQTGAAPLTITNEIIECNIIDAITGKPIADTTTSFLFIKPKSADSEETTVAHMVWGPKGPGRISFMIPDQVMQRADREELEVRWGTGNHPDYENHSPAERIPLKQFFKEDTKSARDTLSTIKLTPKK
ncbi:MAG: hypothetical protein IAG10_15455, partial [Planctomycetaceae bacterium]|nr:hypothetical protein [Planctomycetaceae bacterium]